LARGWTRRTRIHLLYSFLIGMVYRCLGEKRLLAVCFGGRSPAFIRRRSPDRDLRLHLDPYRQQPANSPDKESGSLGLPSSLVIDATERIDHSCLVNCSCFSFYLHIASPSSHANISIAFQSSGRCTSAYSHAAVLSNIRPIPFVRHHLCLVVLNSIVSLVRLDP
jgi:hypothetical protein